MQPRYDEQREYIKTDEVNSASVLSSPGKKPHKKVKFLLKTLNAKNLTRGFKLGDGTSGKVYLASTSQSKTYALK